MGLSIEIVDNLKQILRTKRISYRQLAEKIDMSEAAIKRAFSERAFSLKRLEEICTVLKISTHDLIKSSDHLDKLQHTLNEDQELLLASDEKLMCLFYLISSGHNLAFIRSKYRYSEPEITRYLLALDKVNLIRLDSENRLKVLVRQDFYWMKGGILQKYYSKMIRQDFTNETFDKIDRAEGFASGFLSKSSIETLRRKFQSLEEDIRDMMQLDTKYRDQNMSNITVYFAFRPWTIPILKKHRRSEKT